MKMVVRRSIAIAAGLSWQRWGRQPKGLPAPSSVPGRSVRYNSAIPLMLRAPSAAGPQLDVRQDRQYAGHCNMATLQAPAIPGATEGYCATMINSTVVPFAAAHPGHHYVLGDEPDQVHGYIAAVHPSGTTPSHRPYWRSTPPHASRRQGSPSPTPRQPPKATSRPMPRRSIPPTHCCPITPPILRHPLPNGALTLVSVPTGSRWSTTRLPFHRARAPRPH